jgi:hypothetical protein
MMHAISQKKQLRLFVRNDNPGARRCYESVGLKPRTVTKDMTDMIMKCKKKGVLFFLFFFVFFVFLLCCGYGLFTCRNDLRIWKPNVVRHRTMSSILLLERLSESRCLVKYTDSLLDPYALLGLAGSQRIPNIHIQ